MTKTNKNVAVVYLIWLPYGIEFYKKFIQSYINSHAGYEHDLIFLFNGVQNENELQSYYEYAKTEKVKYKSFFLKTGQDIEAYFWVSERLNHTHLLFLNSFSRILHNNWLQYYVNAIEVSGVGIVGATGSWESIYTNVFKKYKLFYETNKSSLYNFRKYKLFLKAFFYWQFIFKPFPNPHIRTNAFIIKRDLFLGTKNKIRSKFSAHIFENGRKGLSNQLSKKGYELLVVDKFGNTYPPDRWPNSKTFRIEDQQNLLIEDNRTKVYSEANIYEQKRLTEAAWGIT